jgi:hypothetical protein
MGIRIGLILLGISGLFALGFAQEEPPAVEPSIELMQLVDSPTAGCLKKGQYEFRLRIFPQGGVLAGFAVGLFDRFTMGVSYGGINIIGSEAVDWNEQPGVLLKYRLIEESFIMPAVALGFTNQGYGAWVDEQSTSNVRTVDTGNRYTFKAKGLFAVAGKNFDITQLGTIGFHAGVSYNAIEDNDDKNLDAFLGIDKSLNEELSLIAEYDLGTNDNGRFSIGRDRGYLNASVRWVFARKLGVEFIMKDILNNLKDSSNAIRELRLTYTETL